MITIYLVCKSSHDILEGEKECYKTLGKEQFNFAKIMCICVSTCMYAKEISEKVTC